MRARLWVRCLWLRWMLERALVSLVGVRATKASILRHLRLCELRWVILRVRADRWSGDVVACSSELRQATRCWSRALHWHLRWCVLRLVVLVRWSIFPTVSAPIKGLIDRMYTHKKSLDHKALEGHHLDW